MEDYDASSRLAQILLRLGVLAGISLIEVHFSYGFFINSQASLVDSEKVKFLAYQPLKDLYFFMDFLSRYSTRILNWVFNLMAFFKYAIEQGILIAEVLFRIRTTKE